MLTTGFNQFPFSKKGFKHMVHFPDQKEKPTKELAPGVRARVFWGDDLMLMVADLDPHAEVPAHKHPHEQAGIVLEGELEFVVAGELRMLHAGDIYLIPSNSEHRAKTGEGPAKVLDIFTPLREDLID